MSERKNMGCQSSYKDSVLVSNGNDVCVKEKSLLFKVDEVKLSTLPNRIVKPVSFRVW